MNPVAPRSLSPNASPVQPGPSTPSATPGLFERLKIDRQKAMPLLFAGALLLLFGVVFFGSKLLKKEETNTNPETEVVNSLSPPSARTATAQYQPSGSDKYSPNYKAGRLNPSSTNAEARELARQQAEALSGQPMAVRSYHTNEGVTLPAEQAVPTLGPTYRPPAKAATQQSLQQDILAHQRENQQTIRTLYGNPETKAERAARLAEEEEKRYNRQQRERLMSMTERAMDAQSNASAGATARSSTDQLPRERSLTTERFASAEANALQMDTYHQVKALSGNRLSPSQQKLFAREIDAEARGESGVTTAVRDPGKGVRTPVQSDEGVGFIGTGGKRVARSQNASTRNLSIPAVIHGDADNVVVQPGGTVAIRLIQDTQLLLNGELVFMPAQTLLAGTCSLNGERVQIRVTNIRQGAYLYSTDLDVYDLDGQVGIRVPGLADKTAASQTLVQAGSQGAANPMMLIPQGSAANQIGTQVGVQAASSLFNGVRQYAMTKLSSTRVTIRPNYQVFLKAGGNSAGRRSNKTFALDEE